MRENSGKGDSNTGLLDPTIKEHQAEQGRSGEASLKSAGRTGKERTGQRDGRGGGGR